MTIIINLDDLTELALIKLANVLFEEAKRLQAAGGDSTRVQKYMEHVEQTMFDRRVKGVA